MDAATWEHLDVYRLAANILAAPLDREALYQHLERDHADQLPPGFERRVPPGERWGFHVGLHAIAELNEVDVDQRWTDWRNEKANEVPS